MPVTQSDIAKKANVSSATVSRVVNNVDGAFISDETRRRVLDIAREMGYRPNHAARALATGRTNVIALWMPGIISAYFAQVIHCVQKEIRQDGFEMITSEFGEQTGWISGEMGCSGWPVDGILAYGGGAWLRAAMEQKRVPDMPFVSMGPLNAGVGDIVEVTLAPGTKSAVQHLIHTGCRRIVHLLSEWTNFRGDQRRDAYVAAMEEAGMQPNFIVCGEGTRAGARDAARNYLETHPIPDGILCANDDLAIGTYRGLRDLGLRIPDDVALVGCDGIEDTEYLDPPISTIVQPVEEMCRIGWQFLQQRMAEPTREPRKSILSADLVVRESSRTRNV